MEQNPTSPIQQPTAPTTSTASKSKLPLVLSIIALVLLVGIGSYYLGKQSMQKNTPVPTPIPTLKLSPTKEPQESTIPEGYIEYTNEDLGFSFAYPQEWGQVQEGRVTTEESLKSILNTFKNVNNVRFGIIEKNYAKIIVEKQLGGRGGTLVSYQGFEEKDGKYFRVYYDEYGNRTLREEFTDYLLVRGVNTFGIYNASLNYFDQLNFHAVFNLNDETFPAMNFYVESSSPEAEALHNVLKTFKLLK